jgi:predicted aminopeptidase
MNDDFDELDRALFALPLEEPPADLRRSILAATVYAPPETPLLRTWEAVFVGAVLALAAWLVLAAVADAHAVTHLADGAAAIVRGISAPATLAWLGAGLSTALWLSLVNLTPFQPPLRSGRS